MFITKDEAVNSLISARKQSTPKLVTQNALAGKLAEYSPYLYMRVADACDGCEGGGGYCTADSQGSYCCATCNPGCSNSVANIGVANGSARVAAGASISADKAYAFRDKFLSKSAKGRAYTDYYYKISRLASVKGAINFSTIQSHVDFAVEAHKVANLLQNGTNSDVPVTPAFYKQASDMISHYRSLSKNAEFVSILNQIQRDLNQYKGKSRSEILATLE